MNTSQSAEKDEDLTPPGPLAPEERDQCLDVLRGLAVLGILLVNVRSFAFPVFRWHDASIPSGTLHALDLGVSIGGRLAAEDPKLVGLLRGDLRGTHWAFALCYWLVTCDGGGR